jgi:glucose/arabinose dehydrogenase
MTFRTILLATTSLVAASVFAFAQDEQSPFDADQAPGKRFEIKAGDLPEPYMDEAVRNAPNDVARAGNEPKATEGFTVSLFAEGLKHPRKLLVLENGDVLLAEQRAGYITFLRDEDSDGKADTVSRFADGFEQPYGMAVVPAGEFKGHILVADTQGIWRVPFKLGGIRPDMGALLQSDKGATEASKPADHIAVTDQGVFGDAEGHSTRSLAIDPKDGSMYVGVGSMGNIAEEPEVKASIQLFDASGKNQRTFASGTRNPIGMHFHPETGKLWAVVQERDGLGAELCPTISPRSPTATSMAGPSLIPAASRCRALPSEHLTRSSRPRCRRCSSRRIRPRWILVSCRRTGRKAGKGTRSWR